MRPKDLPASLGAAPDAVRPARRPRAEEEDRVAVLPTLSPGVLLVRCSTQSAPSVARRPRSPSSPRVADLSIAPIASEPAVVAAAGVPVAATAAVAAAEVATATAVAAATVAAAATVVAAATVAAAATVVAAVAVVARRIAAETATAIAIAGSPRFQHDLLVL